MLVTICCYWVLFIKKRRNKKTMSELKQVSMDFLITLIYEAKKHRDFVFGLLLGILVGKII